MYVMSIFILGYIMFISFNYLYMFDSSIEDIIKWILFLFLFNAYIIEVCKDCILDSEIDDVNIMLLLISSVMFNNLDILSIDSFINSFDLWPIP